jgi:hypothetical protein
MRIFSKEPNMPADVPIGMSIDARKFVDRYGLVEALGAVWNEIELEMESKGIKPEVIETIASKIGEAGLDLSRFFPMRERKPLKVHNAKPKGVQELLFTEPKEVQDALFSK